MKAAIALDRRAALRSASWGLGQLMGFNAEIAAYSDVESMVAAMVKSEDEQLNGMAGEIAHNHLDASLRAHNWPAFARAYNGPDFARNQYDVRLAAAHQRFSAGLLPDLTVRAAQIYLMYCGFDPGPVDGIMGRWTRSALQEFERAEGLAETGELRDDVLERLERRGMGS